MTDEFKWMEFSGEIVLLCQHCGHGNLHHHTVDVHARSGGEDGVTVTTRAYGEDGPMTSNPSSRRDGVSIVFWCEECAGETILTLAQHKGASFLRLAPGRRAGQVSDEGGPSHILLVRRKKLETEQ